MNLSTLTITDAVPVGTVELEIIRLKLHRYVSARKEDKETHESVAREIIEDPRLFHVVATVCRDYNCRPEAVEGMEGPQLSRVGSEIITAIDEELQIRRRENAP